MRTVPLKSIFQGASALLGAELVSPGSPDFAGIIAALNTHIETGWTYDFWPEWTVCEQRAYRDPWNDTDTFDPGREVYFAAGDAYYTANSAPNAPAAGESPATDPAKWTALTTFSRYVALDQPGRTPIGEVARMCRFDPRLNPAKPGELRFDITDLGIMPDWRAGNQVWVEFRLRPPTFSSDLYDAERLWQAEDVCFDPTTWECYRALQATQGNGPTALAYWSKVAVPAILRRFLERAVYADLLKADGAADKAADQMTEAYNFLSQAQDDAFAQQGQYSFARVATYR